MSAYVRRPSRVRSHLDSDPAFNWQAKGLCRYEDDPDVFYPTGKPDSPAYQRNVAIAKEICWRCPVRETCLTDALDSGELDGVRGGYDETERRAMLAGNRPRPVPLPQWRVCRSCGERKIRPEWPASVDMCDGCRNRSHHKARPAPMKVVAHNRPLRPGERICRHCEGAYTPTSRAQQYCSHGCVNRARACKARLPRSA